MKITKKMVAIATETKKGMGFNPSYEFRCELKGFVCTKPFNFDREVFVDFTKDGEFQQGSTVMRGTTKKDFVEAVFVFINENS